MIDLPNAAHAPMIASNREAWRKSGRLSIRVSAATRRFLCRGCYFILEEAPGATLADIPADWKCPDCGTDKGNLRLYRAAG